jgi:hypothetical protein
MESGRVFILFIFSHHSQIRVSIEIVLKEVWVAKGV